MAVVWLPVDEKLLGAARGFAAASWRRADLDAAWVNAGWYVPPSGSVAADVFDGLEQRQWTGDRLVSIGLNADATSIVAVTVEFAYFAEDEEEEPVITEERLSAGWSALPHGTRADFDAVWRTAAGTVAEALGPPEVSGTHHDEWHHAIWRAGDTLIAVVQGENIDTYGCWDEAALWLVPHPASEPVLSGPALYDVMWGRP
ncbi:hypothetical protein [Actinophytocola sp. KF-1]